MHETKIFLGHGNVRGAGAAYDGSSLGDAYLAIATSFSLLRNPNPPPPPPWCELNPPEIK